MRTPVTAASLWAGAQGTQVPLLVVPRQHHTTNTTLLRRGPAVPMRALAGVPVGTSTEFAAFRLCPHARWKKRKEECIKAGNCEMGGFTRLLHSGQSDDLMDELPTVVVDPLPQSMVEHSWYVVLNRPYAFVQWTQKVTIPEKYVLMSEPDHIFLRPMPNFMNGNDPGEQRVPSVWGHRVVT